jgi:hypothetical protein
MVRSLQIAVICWLSVWLPGCTPAEKQKPIWDKVKIGDIAPAQTGKQSIEPLSTINLVAYIFEMPAENVGKLENIWRTLYTTPLRFNDYNAFKANWFSVRFGQIEMWNKTIDLLRAVGGRRIVKVSLLLPDGQPIDLAVSGLNSQQTVSYVSTDGSRESAAIGPGVLVLRIKAQKIPASRGVCSLTAWPVFSPPIRSPVPQLAARARLRELPFDCAGFGLKMSPGDFVILGPEKYISDQMALGGLFFNKPEGSLFFSETDSESPQLKPAVKIFLLVCTGINY